MARWLDGSIQSVSQQRRTDSFAAVVVGDCECVEVVDVVRVELELRPDVYRCRARVLTALIDGSEMQIEVGPRRRYLDSVSQAALQIALTGPNHA